MPDETKIHVVTAADLVAFLERNDLEVFYTNNRREFIVEHSDEEFSGRGPTLAAAARAAYWASLKQEGSRT